MKTSTSSRLYTGQDIFVGLDVHKRTYTVVARCEHEVVKKWTTQASPQSLVHQLCKYFEGAKIFTVYEAGFSGFALHRELVGAGIDNLVVHAASVEISANNRVKTDKRDAQKLAALLEAGRLTGIRIPSQVQEEHRLLTRTRQQLVEDRTAVMNKIRMKFHQMGLIRSDEKRVMSHQFVEELLTRTSSSELILVVESYQSIWRSLEVQIKKLNQALKDQAKKDSTDKIYRSVPGVGAVSARVLANELGDMSQFRNERQLFAYTGLTPSEHSSGDNIRRGHITRQGNRRLRAILVELAWRAIGKDGVLNSFFERLYPRIGKKKAIVAVARKLIGRIRSVLKKGGVYQLDYSEFSSFNSTTS